MAETIKVKIIEEEPRNIGFEFYAWVVLFVIIIIVIGGVSMGWEHTIKYLIGIAIVYVILTQLFKKKK